MKKLLFLIIVLPLFFCGCADTEMLSGENPEYMISSLGFEKKEDEIFVFMEALVINSEDTSAEKKLILLKGKGKAILEETGGESRKGRIRIVIKRFI